MTNKKSTKKALLSSVLSLVLCLSMLIGTTFAWFTDSVTSSNNIIKSGNLDVELYYQNSETSDWVKVDGNTNVFKQDTLWEPGHTEVVQFKVVNEGSLALKYQLGIHVVDEEDSVSKDGVAFELSDYIYYGVVAGEENYSDRAKAVEAVKADAKPINNDYMKQSNLKANEEAIVTMVVYMPETVGNEANYGKGEDVPTIQLGVDLFATQYTYEKDSFNEKYDLLSDYEKVERVNSASEVAGKFDMNKDVAVVLPAGTSDVSMIALHGTGESESDFAIVGNNSVFSGNLEVNNHSNLKLADDATLVIDGITVNGTLKVASYYKNIIIRNVQAKSIEVYDRGNVTIEKCEIEGADNNGIYLVAAKEGYNVYLYDNYIKNSAKNAVQISGCASGATYGAGKVEVEGNTFESWCQINDKARAAFKVWGDSRLAPEDITTSKALNADAKTLVQDVYANNTFISSATFQEHFDFYGYVFSKSANGFEIKYGSTTTSNLADTLAGLKSGDVLRFSAGTYNVSGTHVVPDGVTVTTEAGAEVTFVQLSTYDDIFACEGDAVIENINFVVNNKVYAVAGNTKNHDTDGDITVRNCTFRGTAAKNNFGVYKNLYGNLTVENCKFDSTINNAICGVNNQNGSTTTVVGCTFVNFTNEAIGYVIANTPATFEADVIAANTGLNADNVIGY